MKADFFETLQLALTAWLFAWSLVLFFTMALDKRRAEKGRYRIPERRLFLLAFLGGAIGGFFGMRAFRHKTKHAKFALGFPALAIFQAAAWLYLVLWPVISRR